MIKLTSIGLQILWRNHDNKANGTFVPEHLVSPPANGAHALHSSYAIIGNKDLSQKLFDHGYGNGYLASLGLIFAPHSNSALSHQPYTDTYLFNYFVAPKSSDKLSR